MKQQGTVVSLSGDTAAVQTVRMSACGGNCQSCGGCSDMRTVYAENPINAQIGDTVEIEMPSATVLAAALIVYVIPIAVLIAGYLIGSVFFDKEWQNIISGIFPMFVSYIIISAVTKKNKNKYKSVITKIVNPEICVKTLRSLQDDV